MTTHSIHEDIVSHGLADDCPRCTEIADAPHVYLDSVNWALLIDRFNNNLPARSDNEKRALLKIELAVAVMRRKERSGL